jgi:hypothetical protein
MGEILRILCSVALDWLLGVFEEWLFGQLGRLKA